MSKYWTTDNIPDQKGKVILITGANSGLGFGSTKELAKKNAKVIMAVRNLSKGQTALDSIKSEVPHADLELMKLDLADLQSVLEFTAEFKKKHPKLDILMNNAGVMMPKNRLETKQGFEIQFGTNHLGHFLLTNQLLDLIEKTPNSRIVIVSSLVAKMKKADIYWNDLQWEKSYDRMGAYAQSKLANMLFGMELHNRLKAKNSSTLSVLAHPGHTATNLQDTLGLFGKILNFVMGQKLEMGILSQLRAATDLDVKGGEYFGPHKMSNYRGYPILNEPNQLAHNREVTEKLWQVSQDLIDQKLN